MDEKRLVDGTTALAEKQPRVIKIETAERPQNVRLRVAAYTRVSSDSEDQLNSFAAQNRYYTELISSKAEWRMVDIYADEGITGTSVAKRDDFQRMMADCRRGLIDQILVKSISRFARNTKDCLQNIRELKELGVNVRFEREGIDTVNVSSELITAIYAAFAQKESESISGNRQWGYQRSMEQGTFNTYHAPVGFTLTGGNLQINQAEAPTIQRIFTEYLSGSNSREIAAALNKEKTLGRHWRREAIDYILQNERYAGNALLQKRYTTDSFPRKRNATEENERCTSSPVAMRPLFRRRCLTKLSSCGKHERQNQHHFTTLFQGRYAVLAEHAFGRRKSIKNGIGAVTIMKRDTNVRLLLYQKSKFRNPSAAYTTS